MGRVRAVEDGLPFEPDRGLPGGLVVIQSDQRVHGVRVLADLQLAGYQKERPEAEQAPAPAPAGAGARQEG